MGDYDRRTPELTNESAVRLVVVDTALLPHVGDALGILIDPGSWEMVGDPVSDIVAAAWDMLDMYYENSLVGQVANFVSAAPSGWLEFDGSTYSEDDYPELFGKVPAAWQSGTDFTLPDMQDVFVGGVGSAGVIGAEGGANSYALTVGQLPGHSHLYTPPVLTIDAETPTTPVPTAGIGAPTQTGATGDGDSVDNRPDYLALVVAIYAGRA